MPHSRRWMLYLLGTVGVLAGVLLREPIQDFRRQRTPDAPPVQITLPPDARAIAAERCKPHMDWADVQAQRAIEEHLGSLAAFFGDVKKRTPEFAKDVLGWGSKGRLVLDKLPFTRNDRHAVYLRERFETRFFTPDQLSQSVESVVKSYGDSVRSIEGMMLVKMRADIADLPQEALPNFATNEVLEQAFAQAIEEAQNQAQTNLRGDVIREVASTIGAEVLTMAAVRLGVSGGILAAGAGTSWATLGVGLAAGVIVDWAVQKVWNWWADPVGDLAGMMNEKLEEIHRLIVEGDGSQVGLRAKLLESHEQRKLVRRQAVQDLIVGKVQP